MNKKFVAFFSLFIILVFIGYMVYDSIHPEIVSSDGVARSGLVTEDSWLVSNELQINAGPLKAVTVSQSGNIYLGGDSYVTCYDKNLNVTWNLVVPSSVTSLSSHGDSVYASTMDQILIISKNGELLNELGPFEKNCIITSVSVNRSLIAFADAGNKMIFFIDKGGEVKKMVGQRDGQFIVPSPYFDIALSDENSFYIANTGHRRVEKRNMNGEMVSNFGEPGTAAGAFCGCCNPAHFVVIPNGFITAEKGINRIKILNIEGEFVEFVSSNNDFTASVPLDIASFDGKTIYAVNPADSKLYIFTRK